jgi:hypothetical protein
MHPTAPSRRSWCAQWVGWFESDPGGSPSSARANATDRMAVPNETGVKTMPRLAVLLASAKADEFHRSPKRANHGPLVLRLQMKAFQGAAAGHHRDLRPPAAALLPTRLTGHRGRRRSPCPLWQYFKAKALLKADELP